MDSSFIRPGADASRARREAGAAPPRGWRTWLFGRPLPTADAPHQAIGKAVGLAVFSSDALSSTAYATQEIMIILAMAGTAALSLVLPISVAIVALLAIVTFSYEQTIHAYPGGGGAYIVARDNLGELPAQVAGAALLMDYILTVAVSISSGVAQVASAFPAVHEHKVALAVLLVVFVMFMNLRGVKESGVVFAVPTFFFVAMMSLTVGTALVRHLLGTLARRCPTRRRSTSSPPGRSGSSSCCTPSRAAPRPSPASRRSRTASPRSRSPAAAMPGSRCSGCPASWASSSSASASWPGRSAPCPPSTRR